MKLKQVDVSRKPLSFRKATAVGRLALRPSTMKRIREGRLEKGDPIALAQSMAVVAVKQTPNLIALCHPLKIEGTEVRSKLLRDAVEVSATVSATEKTGVEMEALTAVTVALLNVWDVVKAYEKDSRGQYPLTRIEIVRVTRKEKEPIEATRTA